MQALLRTRLPARSIPRIPSRAMGSYATFKVPRIDNEPNVSSFMEYPHPTLINLETLCSWLARSQRSRGSPRA